MSDPITPTEPQSERTQHYWDPATGQRQPIKVRSIKHRFKLGKGGALAGAQHQATPARKTLKPKSS